MKKIIVCIIILMVLVTASPVFAENDSMRKLGRGLANIGTGFFELPKNVVIVTDEEGWLAGITYGLVKGFAWTVLRTTAGLYETFTFWLPVPENFEPIIKPEFILGEEY